MTFLELQNEKIELETKWKCTRHSGNKIVCDGRKSTDGKRTAYMNREKQTDSQNN